MNTDETSAKQFPSEYFTQTTTQRKMSFHVTQLPSTHPSLSNKLSPAQPRRCTKHLTQFDPTVHRSHLSAVASPSPGQNDVDDEHVADRPEQGDDAERYGRRHHPQVVVEEHVRVQLLRDVPICRKFMRSPKATPFSAPGD